LAGGAGGADDADADEAARFEAAGLEAAGLEAAGCFFPGDAGRVAFDGDDAGRVAFDGDDVGRVAFDGEDDGRRGGLGRFFRLFAMGVEGRGRGRVMPSRRPPRLPGYARSFVGRRHAASHR
jgi:hypothetical protein